MSILPSNMIYISKVKAFKFLSTPGSNKTTVLCLYDNFSWASNCFVGPPSIGKSIALKITPFGLCEIAWFPWQPVMRFKTVGYVRTNYFYLSRNYKSCRNNKKRENREYYFITCIFPTIKLKFGFRISCSVRRKLFEESTTTALTPNILGISTFLGFLKSGGNSNGVTAM